MNSAFPVPLTSQQRWIRPNYSAREAGFSGRILVRSMRARAIILWLYLCGPILADPHASINGNLPPQEIKDICAVVRAATSDPINFIAQLSADEHVPGSIPYETMEYSKNGPRKIIEYQRTDLVRVITGPRRGGTAYTVQKIEGRWKIVEKGWWIH